MGTEQAGPEHPRPGRSSTAPDPPGNTRPLERDVVTDVEDSQDFQLWRFRHVETVERTIGFERGTGGSSGVGFLRTALELTSFPELHAVRTEIGSP